MSEAMNWLPATRPTTNVLMPRPWCTCKGSTGNAIPMIRKPINTTVMIGSNADVTERAIAMDGSDVVADIVRHLQLIDRPDEILLRLRRVAGRAAIPVGAALHVLSINCSILGFLKWIVSGVLVEN